MRAGEKATTRPGGRRRQAGFTLIEVMIAVVVVAILAAIAYPSYTRFIDQSRRTDARAGLMEAAQQLERCYTVQSTYVGCTFRSQSPDGFYAITAQDGSGGAGVAASEYLLIATPQGVQTRDSARCTTLTLSNTGERDSTGSSNDCWQ